MKSSSNRGMSAIEIIVVLTVLSVVFAVYFFRAGNPGNDSVRVSALLAHMKLMANAAEEQKRHLGYYPLNIDALMSKDEYLHPNGNSARTTNALELRNDWSGPYLKGVSIAGDDRVHIGHRYVDLSAIMKANTRGYIEYLHLNRMKPGIYYSIYGANVAAEANIDQLAEKVLELCNKEAGTIYAKTAHVVDVAQNSHLKPCGYRSWNGKILKIYYYIAEI